MTPGRYPERYAHADGIVSPQEPLEHGGEPRGRYLALLTLTALGVVCGDIGTSPMYAMRESFHSASLEPTRANILGVLSLIFWSLILVVSVKYAVFVLRADNRGEGGILALTALVTPVGATRRGGRWALIVLGLFGTALMYGDGMITPVISVLGAVEGLKVVTPLFEPYILPIAIAVLVARFAVQSRGTARIGRVFGPITLIWFLTLAVLGVSWIVREPAVLGAVGPWHAVRFFAASGWQGFLVMGSVFLVVTGGEALYADLGHFGRRAIRLAWFSVALPGLLLNYFGQGALLLLRPEAVENPFYLMGPTWFIYPQVAIATMAAIIASQALISAVFSLTMQAVQLGYLPRVEIRHTSAREIGQIYIPSVNWILLASCIGLVLGFRSSSAIAAAYGVAVTTTMVVTVLLLTVVERERWGWSVGAVALFSGVFLTIDLAFWGANIVKVPQGGWFPLVVGVLIFTGMTTWKTGRQILARRLSESTLPWEFFVQDMLLNPPRRVPGTAVYMYGNPGGDPAGAAAQPQALPCSARAGGAAERRYGGSAPRARGRARPTGGDGGGGLPRSPALRLHGEAVDHGGPGADPHRWGPVPGSEEGDLLRRARDPDRVPQARDGDLARKAVLADVAERAAGHLLLRAASGPGRRARLAGGAVADGWRRSRAILVSVRCVGVPGRCALRGTRR